MEGSLVLVPLRLCLFCRALSPSYGLYPNRSLRPSVCPGLRQELIFGPVSRSNSAQGSSSVVSASAGPPNLICASEILFNPFPPLSQSPGQYLPLIAGVVVLRLSTVSPVPVALAPDYFVDSLGLQYRLGMKLGEENHRNRGDWEENAT